MEGRRKTGKIYTCKQCAATVLELIFKTPIIDDSGTHGIREFPLSPLVIRTVFES